MTTELNVLSLYPELMNVHGDAGNAAVLAARSSWAGLPARVTELGLGDAPATRPPDIVVIGSGFDADARVVLGALHGISSALHDWHASSVPLLAVGTGWELLAAQAEVGGATLEGIGLFTGRSMAVGSPASGPLVVESGFGELVGYEYHLRHYELGPGEVPLGQVVAGLGNGAASRVEGARTANAFGTHLAGPLLARNPRFADQLLALAGVGRGLADQHLSEMNEPSSRVDGWAAASNARIRRGT